MTTANTIAALNAASAALGARLVTDAIAAGNTEFFRKFRDLTVGLYDVMIDICNSKADFPEWHAAFMKANIESPLHELDKTGEFTRIVEQLKDLDMSGYYFQEIIPLIRNGSAPLIAELNTIKNHFAQAIEACAIVRRQRMSEV
jgi:hypothetical protein